MCKQLAQGALHSTAWWPWEVAFNEKTQNTPKETRMTRTDVTAGLAALRPISGQETDRAVPTFSDIWASAHRKARRLQKQ